LPSPAKTEPMIQIQPETPLKGSIEEKAYKYSVKTYDLEIAPAIDGYMAGYKQALNDLQEILQTKQVK
jgi:hypothetical protein